MSLDHFFVRKTRLHTIALQNSPPCAKELYDWLLRQAPAGQLAEIHLEQFQAEQSGRLQGKGYQLRWIKDCLKQLIELELVDVVYKFSGKVFKLVTWHPLQKNAPPVQLPAPNVQTNADFQPSNPISASCSYRDKEKTTDKPTRHPVEKSEQEGAIDSRQIQPIKPTKPVIQERSKVVDPIAKEAIEAAGFQLNNNLKAIVCSKTLEIILAAVEAAKQYQHRLQNQSRPLRRQPEAVLVAAIQQEWNANPSRQGGAVQVMPDEFGEWFELARSLDVVQASSIQAEVTQHPPGVLCVLTSSEGWRPFDQMRVVFSLKRLRVMKGEWDGMMRSGERTRTGRFRG
ncbi:MAG: hypothetical protein HC860_13635 [Alkalinema sp. RU_4_3]|nr:hypothetical protein [Alkalinema sp. RU_4_3]